jgi:hypothetical protein
MSDERAETGYLLSGSVVVCDSSVVYMHFIVNNGDKLPKNLYRLFDLSYSSTILLILSSCFT